MKQSSAFSLENASGIGNAVHGTAYHDEERARRKGENLNNILDAVVLEPLQGDPISN
jgi:hypothetical protein